jgi:hypothetical protein
LNGHPQSASDARRRLYGLGLPTVNSPPDIAALINPRQACSTTFVGTDARP